MIIVGFTTVCAVCVKDYQPVYTFSLKFPLAVRLIKSINKVSVLTGIRS